MEIKQQKEIKMIKKLEFLGVAFGIIGAFLVANNVRSFGYPLFTLSSLLLAFSSYKQGNKNLFALQFVFLLANINGLMV